MQKQSPDEMTSFVDQVASQQLGAAPQAPQAPQPAPQQQPAEAPKTQTEAAIEKASPETEGDAAAAKSFTIDMGEGQTRELTEQQVKGVLERYKALNYQNMQTKPMLGMMAGAMKEMGMSDPKQFGDFLGQAIAKAKEKNTTFGGPDEHPNQQGQPPQSGQDPQWETKIKEWSEKNAVDLPPGYSEMMQGQQQQQQQMAKMLQMVQQLAGQNRGQLAAAQQATQQVNQRAAHNTQQAISLNLNRAQQQLGLPDDAAQDFMTFATERGFMTEDFLDPGLTMKVAQDFNNARNSGELERLKSIVQKRQAFSGNVDPTAAGAGGAGPQGDADLAALTDFVKSKRY